MEAFGVWQSIEKMVIQNAEYHWNPTAKPADLSDVE